MIIAEILKTSPEWRHARHSSAPCDPSGPNTSDAASRVSSAIPSRELRASRCLDLLTPPTSATPVLMLLLLFWTRSGTDTLQCPRPNRMEPFLPGDSRTIALLWVLLIPPLHLSGFNSLVRTKSLLPPPPRGAFSLGRAASLHAPGVVLGEPATLYSHLILILCTPPCMPPPLPPLHPTLHHHHHSHRLRSSPPQTAFDGMALSGWAHGMPGASWQSIMLWLPGNPHSSTKLLQQLTSWRSRKHTARLAALQPGRAAGHNTPPIGCIYHSGLEGSRFLCDATSCTAGVCIPPAV